LFGGHQPGEILDMVEHQVVPAAQDRAALARAARAPGRQGGCGRRHRLLGFRVAQIRDGAERTSGRRIEHGQIGGTANPGTAHEGMGPQQVRAPQREARDFVS